MIGYMVGRKVHKYKNGWINGLMTVWIHKWLIGLVDRRMGILIDNR